MMGNPYDPSGLNTEQLAERQRSLERARHLAALSDTEVIAFQPGPSDDRHLMEMSRRLTEATKELTRELVTFRELSDTLARNMTSELITFRESSDTLARRVVFLNRLLVALTVALVVIGGVQIYQAVNSSPATPATTRARPVPSRTINPVSPSGSVSRTPG
jgi:hypothetical protein